MSRFDARTMRDAFRLFEEHEEMRGIVCQYGGRPEQQLAATPRIRWEPSRDTFAGPVARRTFAIQPRGEGEQNQLSGMSSRWVRQAGADLFLHGRTDEDVELLLPRVVIALEDVFIAAENGQPVSGTWDLAREHTKACDRYILSILIKLPMVRALPAATAQTFTITEASA